MNTFNNEVVITNELIAGKLHIAVNTLQRTFTRHSAKFIAGVDYYTITPDNYSELSSDFKSAHDYTWATRVDQRYFRVFTEKGFTKIATLSRVNDKTWAIMEELIAVYFGDKEVPTKEERFTYKEMVAKANSVAELKVRKEHEITQRVLSNSEYTDADNERLRVDNEQLRAEVSRLRKLT